MPEGALPLPIVDARHLDQDWRAILRPGERLEAADGAARALPTLFYRVDAWETALELPLTPNFKLWEFIGVDVREAPAQRFFPRYVPCAVSALAAHLEMFRQAAGSYVHVAANGGYRTPAHQLTRGASPHCWGTAANVYRVGDDWLESRETIERYAALARKVSAALWVRPYGSGVGEADDHLHIDIGYLLLEPRLEPGAHASDDARPEEDRED
ncbi:MAG: hypothetical protein WEA24_03895 [Gemmatimonadota bacterium]